MIVAIFSIIKAPHRKPTKSPRLLSYNNQRQRPSKQQQRRDKQTAKRQQATSKYECSKGDDGG